MVAAPLDEVWSLFNAPDRLASCIPGCQAIRVIDETQCEADLEIQLPFLRLPFRVNARLHPLVPGERLVAEVVGQPRSIAGLVRATLHITCAKVDDAQTDVALDMDFRLSGRLASLGEAMLRGAIVENADIFAAGLQQLMRQGESS